MDAILIPADLRKPIMPMAINEDGYQTYNKIISCDTGTVLNYGPPACDDPKTGRENLQLFFWLDDEGLLTGKEPNHRLTVLLRQPIVGDALLLCGDDEGGTVQMPNHVTENMVLIQHTATRMGAW